MVRLDCTAWPVESTRKVLSGIAQNLCVKHLCVTIYASGGTGTLAVAGKQKCQVGLSTKLLSTKLAVSRI